MTGWRFVLRGLRYYRASYAGVAAGSALGAMVLLGALLAGDSVKATLRRAAEARVGGIEAVLAGGDRMFRAALADEVAATGVEAAAVLVVQGTATAQASGRVAGKVQVVGVDARFWRFAPRVEGGPAEEAPVPEGRELVVNEHLAASLGLRAGETLVLRFPKPGPAPRDAPLAGGSAEGITLSGTIRATAGERQFGRFSLATTQLPQATVFVPIGRLQEEIDQAGRANLLLLRSRPGAGDLTKLVEDRMQLSDYGISAVEVPLANATELRTGRVFFDRRMAEVIEGAFPCAQPVITYLATTITAKGKEIPYSMVTAAGPESAPFAPRDPDKVVLNQWAADDLGVAVGDEVSIEFHVIGKDGKLEDSSAKFRLAGVLPMEGLAADRLWMPEFPGVAAAENTSDWDPGFPLDMRRIRDKDEAYWDEHRGTPKLFLPLAAGRGLFANRWGEFTAFRVPRENATRQEAEMKLLDRLRPADGGMVWRNLGAEAAAAAASPVDFAGLLLGMSVFLMASAVALTAMLFRFHIEQRNQESGLLAAVGIPPRTVLGWRLGEGVCVVAAGSGAGALAAIAYTRGLLRMLDTIWGKVGGGSLFQFHAEPATVATGLAGFVGLMTGVIWWVTRKQARRSASLRLEAGSEEVRRGRGGSARWWAFGFLAAGGIAMAAVGTIGPQGACFLAGFLFLLGGLAVFRWRLWRKADSFGGELTVRRLAEANRSRRPARTLVVVGSLACGVFLVVSVAAFRKHGGEEWRERPGGAGGFALWVETTHPVSRGNGDGADLLELGEARGGFGEIMPLRSGGGDAADCFNLNSVARPRLLAGDVARFQERGAFTIKAVAPGVGKGWNALREGGVTRAFVDETTLLWVLKRKLGERILYQDEWGREFPVEIAGTLADSVFQGCLVVDEQRFLRHFPSSDGYKVFLLDCMGEPGEGLQRLQRLLADRGAEVSTTAARLEAFHGVENTYIAIFHLLGGLGVVLGSAGLGLATARNLSERRHEFALLHTIGVPGAVSRSVVLREVAQSIRWGLGIGVVSALVAIAPNLAAEGMGRTMAWVALLAGLIGVNAWFWSWLGYRGQIRAALAARREFL